MYYRQSTCLHVIPRLDIAKYTAPPRSNLTMVRTDGGFDKGPKLAIQPAKWQVQKPT